MHIDCYAMHIEPLCLIENWMHWTISTWVKHTQWYNTSNTYVRVHTLYSIYNNNNTESDITKNKNTHFNLIIFDRRRIQSYTFCVYRYEYMNISPKMNMNVMKWLRVIITALSNLILIIQTHTSRAYICNSKTLFWCR